MKERVVKLMIELKQKRVMRKRKKHVLETVEVKVSGKRFSFTELMGMLERAKFIVAQNVNTDNQ